MILVVDNYDSFTYNLVQYIGEFDADVKVVRNDALTVEEIRRLGPEKIVISPGPGRPEDAGLSVELVRTLGPTCPILGVCLGHQAVALAYNGAVVQAPEIMHGKLSTIEHNGGPLYADIPSPIQGTRYHSLVVDEGSLPPELVVNARSESGLVMGFAHRRHPVVGLQFHPESILTDYGLQIIENFILRFP
ncbi:MAG: aminodeoxychorismate/anthranilate synthase component II [Candidatus Marinimicrobia bacterium]|nr:aminodeoxychorismate/anthranilate synthase component II [Candidatus Neomarinimicrobiota bacterium]